MPGLSDVLSWRARKQPRRVALAVEGGPALTFAEWQARSSAVARRLLVANFSDPFGCPFPGPMPAVPGPLRRGDRVGLVFSALDWVELAVAYLAVQRAGGVAVPLSDRLAPPQLAHRLAHCGATLVIHGPHTSTAGGLPVPAVPLAALEPGSGTDARRDAGDGAFDGPPVRGGDLAQILYTSGTTKAPRAVAATHDNLVPAFRWDLRRLPLAHSDVLVHAFAIGTNAAQTMLVNALTALPTVLTAAGPTPSRLARLIESSRAGSVFLVPSTAVELLRSGALAGRDLTAVLPGPVAVELARAFPNAAVVNYYTSTEAAPAVASMLFDPARPGSVGRATPGTLRVCDPGGRPLPPGQVGEVWLRAPHARRYLDDPAADRVTFAAGGWVRMGDLGHLDDAGYLHLTGRDGDLVKSGAFKVSPSEVEAVLLTLPGIADAAVAGVPHPVLGAVIGAVVVPRPGTDPRQLTLPAVRAALLGRLSDHELPHHLAVVDRLPRNDGGKVPRRDLLPLLTQPRQERPMPDVRSGS